MKPPRPADLTGPKMLPWAGGPGNFLPVTDLLGLGVGGWWEVGVGKLEPPTVCLSFSPFFCWGD